MRRHKPYTIEDYIITQSGEIINKHNNHKVKPQKNGKGYFRVSIGGKLMFVHRLVANEYIPNPQNKLQVNHKDGNKENNCVDNLEWVTNQENRNHAVENNLQICGDKCSWSKLNENDVIYILNNKKNSSIELAKKFKVSSHTIRNVKNGKTWKQLKRYAEL